MLVSGGREEEIPRERESERIISHGEVSGRIKLPADDDENLPFVFIFSRRERLRSRLDTLGTDLMICARLLRGG